jgi:type I restriction enzyme S subunit
MACCNVIRLSEVRSGFRIDSEFYRGDFVAADHELVKLPLKGIGSCAKVTDGEHGSVKLTLSGVKYLTAENVKQGYVDAERVRYVGADIDERNARARVREGDVLVSIKGTLGEIGLAEKELLPANMNRDVAIIKVHSHISGGYLTAFLRSRFGAYQLAREGSGGVQQMITLGRLRNVQVAVLPQGAQDEVAMIQAAGLENRRQSKRLHADAERFLEEELELNKLSFLTPAGYTARFSTVNWSETFSAGRVDAQCFAPDALIYESWLNAHTQCDRLGSLLKATAKGRQQADSINGATDYCSIKHISGRELVGASKCFAQADAPLAGVDDLLLAITGATIGKIGIVKRYERLAFSGDLLCLRAGSIDPHYLLLALDHKVGQVQFNRWITGSTNGHLAPRDVARVLVPRLSDEAEAKIAELVRSSLLKRQESEQLLEQAKIRVEQLIEAAVHP